MGILDIFSKNKSEEAKPVKKEAVPPQFDMTAYRYTQEHLDGNPHIKERRLYYQVTSEVIMLATPDDCHRFISAYDFHQNNLKGHFEQVDLLKETWIHPHLWKPIKEEVKKMLSKISQDQ